MVYPSRQQSQLIGEEGQVQKAAAQQQQRLPKQRSERYRRLVHGLSAGLSGLCTAACMAPKATNSGLHIVSLHVLSGHPASMLASRTC